VNIWISEIFRSINGEVCSEGQGSIATFIRFAGCSLRCSYCDTRYAWDMRSGTLWSVEEILSAVEKLGCRRVTITGGEPLLQSHALDELIQSLRRKWYIVTIETSGAHDFEDCKPNCWVVDYKLPSSGEEGKMLPSVFKALGYGDFVKFVIGDKDDFKVALEVKYWIQNGLKRGCSFAFSPVHGKLDPKELFRWLVEKGEYDAILNLQLHKIYDFK